jgi:4-hydroxy 2-oxovalerate aldolase
MKTLILDCTLRDGGYYTNWDFTDSVVEDYIACMNSQPLITHVEIGYRSLPKKDYYGKYYYCPEYVLDNFKNSLPGKKLAIMLNEKDTRIEDLPKLLNPCLNKIDLIRMAVAPANLLRAIDTAKKIKSLGFEVAFNLMYMSKWGSDKEFLNSLIGTNGVVEYLYLVDSYGGIIAEEVEAAIKNVGLIVDSKLGFHGHNNMELAFNNSLVAIAAGCKIIDATILGMGRGAGNLKTELLLTYLSSKHGYKVEYDSLSSLVNNIYEMSDFGKLYRKYEWGTNLAYMVSGANSLPQKEVMDWISARSYSINSIVNALHRDLESSENETSIPIFRSDVIQNDVVIVIGGGANALDHIGAIKILVEQNDSISIVHSSTKNAKYYKDINVPQYYCLVGNEGRRMERVFKELECLEGKCVLPPTPRKMGTYIPSQMLDQAYELDQIDFTDKYLDSHFAIGLQIAKNICVNNVYLVGFDGYGDIANVNKKEYELAKENEYLIEKFKSTGLKLSTLTPSSYPNIDHVSIYQVIN